MAIVDTPTTTEFLLAFQKAWLNSTKDYAALRINSEHTLQAALYHHLRLALPDGFSIFTEAVIRLPEQTANETGKQKVVVDLLVSHARQIVAAIELKYTPRGRPAESAVKKDLLSLSRVTNRRDTKDRVAIEMPRFRSEDADVLELSIAPQRKLVFAMYCKQEASEFDERKFWTWSKPDTGYWADAKLQPRNLGVALARADKKGSAECEYFGGPFDRLSK